MPLDIQSKLLRVMQEKEVMRMGSRRVIQLDFRVVCATNLDLESMAKEGRFKYDLLQRINVIPILIPPLRDRKEDIPELVRHFLAAHGSSSKVPGLSVDAAAAIQAYNWPGNVRELSNVVAYLCTMAADCEQIELEDLTEKLSATYRASHGSAKVVVEKSDASTILGLAEVLLNTIRSGESSDFYAFMKQIEAGILIRLHAEFGSNMSQLSKAIKMSRSHLYAKLNEHGILK